MLGVGFYFMKKNTTMDDYYVGGREMGSYHVGLSVVATDVGGGFSIGLGGLGFMMGLSGSWMLFTGLIGAWLSASYLIPKVKKLEEKKTFYTFAQLFDHFYGPRVALVAAVVSIIGYVGFTSSQLLAGAKLASASFDGVNLETALVIMGALAVIYTSIGGIKAVIYTDTFQWIILMVGLFFIGVPMTYFKLGGWDVISKLLPREFFSLTNLTWIQFFNWMVTIIPIWFVGMTLYQRIYACPDEKTAKKAWHIAAFLEYPLMAFMGVILGMFSKVALLSGVFSEIGAQNFDPELGLPLLIKYIFPVGLMGLILASYLSAVLSTADSCLMAASVSVINDVLAKLFLKKKEHQSSLVIGQLVTLVIGGLSLLLALHMESVLNLMLSSYSFMVSGLLVPIIAAFFFHSQNSLAALLSIISGGGLTLFLQFSNTELPYGLDANIFGISLSLVVFFVTQKINQRDK